MKKLEITNIKIYKIKGIEFEVDLYFNVESFHLDLEINGINWKDVKENKTYLLTMSNIKNYVISSTTMKDMNNALKYLGIWFKEYNGEEEQKVNKMTIQLDMKNYDDLYSGDTTLEELEKKE